MAPPASRASQAVQIIVTPSRRPRRRDNPRCLSWGTLLADREDAV